MVENESKGSEELFIVDNSDQDWKVIDYLREWTDIASIFDIATGFLEIGALLSLDGYWQKLEKMRILMGDEVSRRTKQALLNGIQDIEGKLDQSIETVKESNDFLSGTAAIVEALRSKKIECRVYNKDRFHAKAYITHGKHAVVGSSALVGSSNLTYPGLTENVELNVQIRREVELLQQWYEQHWNDAHEITEEILKVIERHTREYIPFEVYATALQEFFRGHEMTATEWECNESKIYPILDHYQKEGYHALLKIAAQYGGAFLCDGVGLGKTYVGLMLIERLIMHDRKRVALFVPKAARKDVWERDLRRYLRHLSGDFSNLVLFNHTDLLRGGDFEYRLDRVKELADVIVIDEAHHFRNKGLKGESRYWRLYDIAEGKTLFMLTATPVNNHLRDLQHMIELFAPRKPNKEPDQTQFKAAPLGIHSLPGHFRRLENALEKLLWGEKQEDQPNVATNQAEAEKVLWSDNLFREIVVQRSRAYVKKSQEQHGSTKAIFPKREDPKVVDYSLRKTYGRLLTKVEDAFNKEKPLFSLAVYYPLAYYIGPDMEKKERAWQENRQKEVVSLIRVQFLKRFESSARAFEFSCENLLVKLLAWATKHSQADAEKKRLDRWKRQHEELINAIHKDLHKLLGEESTQVQDEDIIDDELLDDIEELSREQYKIDEILTETFLDLDQIIEFLRELKKFKPSHDDKLQALIKLLRNDGRLKKYKVLIFSEYMNTARYIREQLEETGLSEVDEVDSATKRDRSDIIRQFAPYYNCPADNKPLEGIEKETRILISTDVLSEGLNLQDATLLINYDLHWNPVRLMQRIGRVDRRLNLSIEEQILADHPERKEIRGTVAFWNFLPPDELDRLLHLYGKVAHKTLRISKVFGIEGKKLLKPEDDYEALKDFLHNYQGSITPLEQMHIEFQQLLKDNPGLAERLNNLPGKVFSGKQHITPGAKAIFFCYALPAQRARDIKTGDEALWSEEIGHTKWYLYDIDKDKIIEEPTEIVGIIRSTPQTPRQRQLPDQTLSEIRKKIEKHITNTYLKKVDAPVGVKSKLKAWMELS
jgi:hypothetical protein